MDIRIGSKIVPINKFIFSHANSWPNVQPPCSNALHKLRIATESHKNKPNSHDQELLIELGAETCRK